MFEEIRKNLNGLKEKIKGIDKKAAVEEYLSLIKRKIELEAELAEKKSKYYMEVSKLKDRQARKKEEHFKFVIGGLVLKQNPWILKNLNKERLEQISFKIEETL